MQETRLQTRSREGCQEFKEWSGCLSTVNGQFKCQQDCSRVSLSLKEVFLSRIVVPWRSEPLGKTVFATKCLRTALLCATVVPHFIWCHVYFFYFTVKNSDTLYSKATIQTLMQRKMSVELRVTSKGEGILTLVGTRVINWVRGKIQN